MILLVLCLFCVIFLIYFVVYEYDLGCESSAWMSARRPAECERVALAQWMELLVGGNPLTIQIRAITRVVSDGRGAILQSHTCMLPRGEA